MTGSPQPIPRGAVLLHIGPYKTGTTAIQRSLHKHRADLATHGVLYPGANPRQRRASWAAVGRSPRGVETVGRAAWRRMLQEIEEASADRVVISSEDFTSAPPEAVRSIVEDLGGSRVHVVMVILPLEGLLPSSWQQRVKSSLETLTYDEWLHEVLERPDAPKARIFWKNQGVDPLVDRYADVVPRERITLVVSDESDRTQLARTFESLLALPAQLLTPGDHQNTSLSLERTELLRRVNQLAADRGWPESWHRTLVHGGMLNDLRDTPANADEHTIPGLPAWAAERVTELGRQRADQVRASGCQVVGDPEALAAPASPTETSASLPDEVSMDLAAAGVAGVVDAAIRRAARTPKPARKPRHPAPAPPGIDDTSTRALARELARRLRGRLVPRR